jgi:hypothetical protein
MHKRVVGVRPYCSVVLWYCSVDDGIIGVEQQHHASA